MSRFLLIAAAFALVLSGCGKEEEQPKMEEAEAPAMEAPSAPAEEATPAEGETMPGEAETGAADSMTEEAAPDTGESMPPAEEAAPATEGTTEETAPQAEQTNSAPEMTGKQVYESTCFACHADGIAGAPKLGDKAAWEPRLAQDMEVLVSHAINGFQGSTGVMPPKGGNMTLTDEQVRAAVTYMVEQVK